MKCSSHSPISSSSTSITKRIVRGSDSSSRSSNRCSSSARDDGRAGVSEARAISSRSSSRSSCSAGRSSRSSARSVTCSPWSILALLPLFPPSAAASECNGRGLPTGAAARSLAAVPVSVGEPRTLEDVVAVARGAHVTFAGPARERVRAAREVVDRAVAGGRTMYGVTTGFGALADTRVAPEQTSALQHGIVTSHATAVGRPLSREEARAMLVLRAHVLALGHSGVRAEVIELMVEMLNRDVVPAVPEQGSLGASGDLAPLAGLALPLIGLGRLLTSDGSTEPGADGLGRAGLRPLELQAKEGLALVNGTQGMVAIGTLALIRSEQLARAADVIAAMTIEASLGTDAPFDERLQRLRPHPGQAASATNLRALLDASPIRESHRTSAHLVQDAYSLRCAPQVHGATRDTCRHVREVLSIETNSVSDNPIVLVEDDDVQSGGNFHGTPARSSRTPRPCSPSRRSQRRRRWISAPRSSPDRPPAPRCTRSADASRSSSTTGSSARTSKQRSSSCTTAPWSRPSRA